MKPGSRSEDVRKQILREWRGFDEATDPERGIQQPSMFMAAILRQAGMSDGLNEEEVRRTWSELAGEFIARHTEPVSVAGGRLVLRVNQPTMRFHLEQMKPLLLQRVQDNLGADHIRSIHFQIG